MVYRAANNGDYRGWTIFRFHWKLGSDTYIIYDNHGIVRGETADLEFAMTWIV
jgi:hypothetical protein